ncbi:ABC transporter ATP-binding protein [Clostridium sp.]|uniref:ABC transporter ATP-binding protein n=1 Tax=Clostridium sp. TaxID=1506 RepID=UPI00290A31DF|nr:ABC transporter ATP-binding protein [Clostridium sp.]MDU5108353.1 ABC transporter ATP-binding protein [Clostridium sp.]
MEKYAIEIKDVTKSYMDGNKKRIILDNVNLQVKPGEFVAIIGPSGSGKSTLLSIGGALLSPEDGMVKINGREISKDSWTDVRRNNIGFIFQNHQLIPYLTVEDQLKMVGKLSNKSHKHLGDELLKEIGLAESKKKFPHQLSGGEKQRVAIARAFMNNPEVIFADEPTASLDKQRGCQVVQLIATEVKKRNKAAVMVTHDERVLDLVDSIYYLEEGKLVKR